MLGRIRKTLGWEVSRARRKLSAVKWGKIKSRVLAEGNVVTLECSMGSKDVWCA